MKTIKVCLATSTSKFMAIGSELIKAGYNFDVNVHNDCGCVHFEFITMNYDSIHELENDLLDLLENCELQYMYYHLEVICDE